VLDGADATDSGVPSEASTDDTAADFRAEAAPDSGPDAMPVPHCAPGGPGLSNCGLASESCCTSLEVTGGTYYRTYDAVLMDGGRQTQPDGAPSGEADPATVSSLDLDKYDVTVARFRQFVGALNAGWKPTEGSGKHTHLNGGQGVLDVGATTDASVGYEQGWVTSYDPLLVPPNANPGGMQVGACIFDPQADTWTPSPAGNENMPMTCVSWIDAYAFCIWDGGFLPTDAELEYAIAGGSEQREYPWGSASPGVDNHYAIYGCYYPDSSGVCSTAPLPNIAPVGTAALGTGRWGHLDLLGNVVQWTLDAACFSSASCIPDSYYFDPCDDCADLTDTSNRIYRGSTFGSYLGDYVSDGPEYFGSGHNGFRCARSP